jgi:flagellar hook-associated protein 3 FlgL
MRISEYLRTQDSIMHLQDNQAAVENLRTQIATGRRIQKPDDDPTGTQQSINTRRYLNAVSTSLRAIGYSDDWMSSSAFNVGEMGKIIETARTEATRAASDTYSDDTRESMATQVKEMIKQAVAVANSDSRGQYLFAGFKVTTQPFTLNADMSVTYNGDGGQIQHEIEPGSTTTVNVAGDNPMFTSTFASLKQLYDGLTTGDTTQIRDSMDSLDSAAELTVQQQSQLGSRLQSLTSTRSRMEKFEVNLKSLLSHSEDVDVAAATLELSSSEQGYQATLSAMAKTLSTSLFDYLG